MDEYSRVLRRGRWLYDGTLEKPVEIVVQNWDYYFEDGYDAEGPDLNEHGEAYYVMFDGVSRSRTFLSLDEAVDHALDILPSPVTWDYGTP